MFIDLFIDGVCFANYANYQTNSSIHMINTRYKNQLHRPVANLSCFQKGAFYSELKIFNSLPLAILECQNNKLHFRVPLRKYLYLIVFIHWMKSLYVVKIIHNSGVYHL
jgi:hypothetical protein